MKKDQHDQCIRHIIIKYQDTKENGNILNPVGGLGNPDHMQNDWDLEWHQIY